MKKIRKRHLCYTALALLLIGGCSNTENSNSENTVDPNKPSLEYKLEDDELTSKPIIHQSDLDDLSSFTSISISGVSGLITNPYIASTFYGEISVKYPTSNILVGKNILYTSAWYTRNTFKRSDDVIEYVLTREDNKWYVEDIKNNADNLIPFNGAVLSVPKGGSVSFEIGDEITITKGSIPVYDVGFYNQNGNRLVVRQSNRLTWNDNGINLTDNNSLAKATNSPNSMIGTINCYYDETNKRFVIDKFRYRDKRGRIFNNVNDGIMLGATLNSNYENAAILEGVRFNLNDTIKVEDNAGLYAKTINFTLGQNKITLDNGGVRDFRLERITTTTANFTHRYEYEIGVASDGLIVSTGSFVETPTNGFKLGLYTAGNTTGEQLNSVLENYFVKGSQLKISGSNITITSSLYQRAEDYSYMVSSLVANALDDLETYNYSYDYKTLKELDEKLQEIGDKITTLEESDDPTDLFRIYNLTGDCNQIYYKYLSATNRNEAVQTKSVWYIDDFSGDSGLSYDRTLEGINKKLDYLKDAGINEILVSAIHNGTPTYANSKVFNACVSNTSNFGSEYGNDFLKAITGEAHKKGMYVQGLITPFNSKLENVWPELKDCFALNINGGQSVNTSEGNHEMLDPANDLVQEKIAVTIDDILACNPDLDGLQVDYIRYGADSNQLNCALGITEAARVKFAKYLQDNKITSVSAGANLTEFRNNLHGTAFTEFNKFEATLITDTVRNIKEVCKKYDKPFTCSVGNGFETFKTWKCQDCAEWARLNIMDGLYIMDYMFDDYWVDFYMNDAINGVNDSCLVVGGVDPSYAGLIPEYYARTIKGALKNNKSAGYALFATHVQFSTKDGWDLIADSSWIESLSPYDKLAKTMKASGDMLLQRCDDIYITYSNQTQSQKETLAKDLDDLYSSITGDDVASCNNAISKLTAMANKTYASNEANNRINEQLSMMLKIAKTKLNIVKD